MMKMQPRAKLGHSSVKIYNTKHMRQGSNQESPSVHPKGEKILPIDCNMFRSGILDHTHFK